MGPRGSVAVLVAVASFVAGCGFETSPVPPGRQDGATIEGTGDHTIGPPSGAGGGGPVATGMDGGSRDAMAGAGGTGPGGGMDAATPDAGGTGSKDASTPECMPDGRERNCGSDVGTCVAGKERCEDGAWGACSGDVGPEDELCDGLNNDCDDATDEGCPCEAGEMQSCGTDVGTCEAGIQACVNGAWGACQGDTVPGVESCATPLDEDCDGTANEGCACEDGATQACGSDVGVCARGLATCAAGQWGDCAGETAPDTESCNGVDDNCDGATDEGCPCIGSTTQPCGTDVGACVAGMQTCTMGAWGLCEGGTPPADETCNGANDDCDTATDEGGNACGGICALSPAVGTPCDGTDGDQCVDDAYECVGANAVACPMGATDVEVCNGMDDDCTSGCDDTFTCCKDATQGCTTGCGTTGVETCGSACTWGACTPPAEVCNGVDDDCVNGCDDTFACCKDDVEGCTTTCGSAGSRTCANDCSWGSCTPPVEVCNGQDDDCVGGCDDSFACCQGSVGSCMTDCGSTGSRTCANDCSWGNCTPPVEVCNGQDDDCVGGCDDAFACCQGDTRACVTGCGTTGVETCADACTWDGNCVPPAEVCNGVDDDCANGCDDSFACCQGALGACMTTCGSIGSHVCAGDCTWGSCTPPAEVCNGADDDCVNGSDDTFACSQGEVGSCMTACGSTGSRTCGNDCTWGSCTPPVEICNGEDDDCANGSDDTFACSQGDTRACVTGCGSSGVETCGNDCTWDGNCVPPAEACNGVDDDCANGCDDTFACCQGAVGSCMTACGSTGSSTCAGDCTWGGCTPPDEACNGADDDCDNATDEDFPAQPLIPPGLTLFFDSPCPSGWAPQASQAGRLAMGSDGDATYAELGGGSTHSHSMAHTHTSSSDNIPSHQHNVTSIATTTDTGTTGVQACDRALPTACACGQCDQPIGAHSHTLPPGGMLSGMTGGAAHSHTLTGGTTGSSPELPAWRATNFCVKNGAQLTAILPEGTIAMFVTGCAAGWTEDESFRDRFLREDDGTGIWGQVGGSNTHDHGGGHSHGGVTSSAGGSHTHSSGGTTGTASAGYNRFYSSTGVAGSHYHDVAPYGSAAHTHNSTWAYPAISTDPAIPVYREIIFCKAQAPICNGSSSGMAGFFDWTCPAGWSELTQYRNYYIRGQDGDITFGETGGSATHQHTAAGHAHTLTSQGEHTHPYTTTPLAWPPWFPEFISSGSCSTCFTWATLAHKHGGVMSAAGGHMHTVGAVVDFATAAAGNLPASREHVLCAKQ